ncbi:MAG: hypothetical protein R3E97_00155 [Candidatus Eisenbacteria bacterium]
MRLGALLVFVLLSVYTILHHEMWRDELQAWMIGRDSPGLGDLLGNTRYEGHPPLWHLCLFALGRVSTDPAAMQMLHVAIASLSSFVVLFLSPFRPWVRWLFVLGYFPFYEYCIKSRGYAWGVLFLFMFCAMHGKWRQGGRSLMHLVAMSSVLGLLSLTSILGAILAIGLFGFLVLDVFRPPAWVEKTRAPKTTPTSARESQAPHTSARTQNASSSNGGGEDRVDSSPLRLVGLVVPFLTGLVLAIVSVLPPADSGYANETVLRFDPELFSRVVSRITHAYTPALSWTLVPVETGWDLPVAVLLFGWTIWLLRGSRRVLGLYLFLTLALLGFFYTKYLGLLWHHGHLYLVWFAALWLHENEAARASNGGSGSPRRDSTRSGTRSQSRSGLVAWGSVAVLLAVQATTGVRAHVRDWKETFSAARETAESLTAYAWTDGDLGGGRQGSPQGEPWLLAGDLDFIASAVVGYLPKGTECFYVAGTRFGTFIRWDEKRLTRAQPGWDAAAVAAEAGASRGRDVVFVSSYDLGANLPPGVRLVSHHTAGLWPDERFWVYEMRVAGL